MARRPLSKLSWQFLRRPVNAESLVRNILIVGSLILLFLIALIGYRSVLSIQEIQREAQRLHETEGIHIRTVARAKETAGRVETEARNYIGTAEENLLHRASRQKLTLLKKEMDEIFTEAQMNRLAETKEWQSFEGAFQAYWGTIHSADRSGWNEQRDRMAEAMRQLEAFSVAESIEHDRLENVEAVKAQDRIKAATIAALLVGLIIVALTVYEIRRILSRLGGAYQETSEARDYLESLLDGLVSGVLVIGSAGTVETANDAFRRLIGKDITTPTQGRFETVFQDSPGLVSTIEKSLQRGSEMGRYYERVELDGRRLFDVFSSPLLLSGERRGVILIFVDITEVEAVRSELRRNRALSAIGQMTAQIAHEIKNPLGSIRFATEMLKRHPRGNGESSDGEVLGVIERSVDHLATIVSELSDYARPRELSLSEVDVNGLIDELAPMVADRLSAKRIEVRTRFDSGLPKGHYDVTELRKLFLNLIINAIDASDEGSVVEVRTGLGGRNELKVEIQDQGSGMDSETLRRLFEPFYTTKKKGTGLGMAISKKIVDLHHGDISVKSRKGEGTTITVKLPTA